MTLTLTSTDFRNSLSINLKSYITTVIIKSTTEHIIILNK